jgi:hypothetical protein
LDYYIRILSASADAPTAGDMAAAAARAGYALAGVRGADPKDPEWRSVDLEYDGDRCPLRIERHLAAVAGDLADVARFSERVGAPGRSKAKKQVREFLAETRQIIALRVPDHVLDSEDWGLVHALLYFLQPRLNGLIQADGEGFYNGDGKLLVALD